MEKDFEFFCAFFAVRCSAFLEGKNKKIEQFSLTI